VTELTGSFQQALAQVDDGDTDEEEEEARRRLQQTQEAVGSSVQPPAPQTLMRDVPVVEGHALNVQQKDAASGSQRSEDEEDTQVGMCMCTLCAVSGYVMPTACATVAESLVCVARALPPGAGCTG
jgi:hypothetical protein